MHGTPTAIKVRGNDTWYHLNHGTNVPNRELPLQPPKDEKSSNDDEYRAPETLKSQEVWEPQTHKPKLQDQNLRKGEKKDLEKKTLKKNHGE